MRNTKINKNTYNTPEVKSGEIDRLKHLSIHTERNKIVDGSSPHINSNIYHLLLKPSTFVNSWARLKNNKGSLTPGIDDETLQGFGLNKAMAIVDKLKNQTFKPKPVRRKWIPKPGRSELRPLGIPTIEDRLVQEAIRGILESIYEPEFIQYASKTDSRMENFGFRPGRNINDLIAVFRRYGQNIDWVIEGDISKAYDTVDQTILLKILARRITDQKFLKLIKAYLQAGVMDDFQFSHTLTGVPQGGIVSPLLFNIYMAEMDKFVSTHLVSLIKLLTKPNSKVIPNPLWRSYQAKANSTYFKYRTLRDGRALSNLTKQEQITARSLLKTYRSNKALQLQTPSKVYTNKPFEIIYLRYADDWIIGITGPHTLAKYIKEKVKSYLHYYLKLSLSEEKTKITYIKDTSVKFLGFDLSIRPPETSKIIRVPTVRNNITRLEKKRTTSLKIKVVPDKSRIIARLTQKGFLTPHTLFPLGKPGWSILDDYEIVLKYKQMLLGLANFYSECDYNGTMHHVEYIYLYSCAKTLAQRHRLTVGQVFAKYGKRLRVQSPQLDKIRFTQIPTYTGSKASPISTKITHKPDFDPFNIYTNWRTKFKVYQHCCLCGSAENIEMHHTNSVKSIKTTRETQFSQLMQQINRKQIPLCHTCHNKVTYGKHISSVKLHTLFDHYLASL